jgi:membrane protease YdiL (CAAX protease family)
MLFLIVRDTRSILVAFFATFTAPLVEEVVYRGLLYSAFQRRVGVALATVFVTILFTAVHVPQYSLGANPDFAALIALFLLSLTLTLVRARTGNLLPCIVLHTIFNASQSILVVIQNFFTVNRSSNRPNGGVVSKIIRPAGRQCERRVERHNLT